MRLEILRRSGNEPPYIETVEYMPASDAETVATALTRLNETRSDPIRWECGCMQKKCGACAMVVQGRPALACGVRLSDCKDPVRIEPLRKFPVVADLIVDRSVLYENLRELRAWLPSDAAVHERSAELAFEASRCLQCGCCLDVCPNFAPGGTFAGMASAIPVSRLLAELPPSELGELSKRYRQRVYAGCGKSLACRKVCPAGIDVDALLVNSNAVAVWKRLLSGRKHN